MRGKAGFVVHCRGYHHPASKYLSNAPCGSLSALGIVAVRSTQLPSSCLSLFSGKGSDSLKVKPNKDADSLCPWKSTGHLRLGSGPRWPWVTPHEAPGNIRFNPTTKIGSLKWVANLSKTPKWDPMGFDNHRQVSPLTSHFEAPGVSSPFRRRMPRPPSSRRRDFFDGLGEPRKRQGLCMVVVGKHLKHFWSYCGLVVEFQPRLAAKS